MAVLIPSFNVKWRYPTPDGTYIEKTEVDFDKEYHPTGHKINSPKYYPDITIVKTKRKKDPSTGKYTTTETNEIFPVKRVVVTLQADSVQILLPHLLGNKISYSNTSIKAVDITDTEIFNKYSTIAENKNFNTNWAEFVKATFTWGHAAMFFYSGEGGKTRCRVYSYGNGDILRCITDINGRPVTLYRKYSPQIVDEAGVEKNITLVDVIDKSGCKTYTDGGEPYAQDKWITNVSPVTPFVYHKRTEGAIWAMAQSGIDNLELLLSALSNDNISKAKAKYVITGSKATTKAGANRTSTTTLNHQTTKIGDVDFFVGGEGVDMKMLQGASLSEAFKFEYEAGIESVFNTIGIVYPEQKSSGDMPTGSMKMMFFPTERKCMILIDEYNSVLDAANAIFKAFVTLEYQDDMRGLDKVEISASIKLFTPQADYDKALILQIGSQIGALSNECLQSEFPEAKQNNAQMIKKEQEEAEAKEKRLLDEEAERAANNSSVTDENITVEENGGE